MPKAAPAKPKAKASGHAKPEDPGYDPMAPRLRAGAAPDRQAREREAKKAKARLADVEKRIAEKEQAVKDLEHLMATPGFYDDRVAADKAVGERQRLLDEVGALMAEWEALQTQAEALG
jgi:uncharacterized coiled-coil protein SlyX